MRAVDVGVGHDDDGVVAQLFEVLLGAHAHPQRRDQGAQFDRSQHLVDPGPLDVKDFAAQRQDCLSAAIASLFGRAAGRIALDDEQFAAAGIALLAVSQFAGQRRGVQRALAPHQLFGLARRLARGGGLHGASHDPFRVAGSFLQELAELLVHRGRHDTFDLGVAQLGLGLPFELRLADFDADDRGQPFAGVLAFQAQVLVLDQIVLGRVGVDRARQRRP